MKIAVTAADRGLDVEVDPRFGRCPYFMIVETDDMDAEAIENSQQALGHGAGIQSARMLVDRGVKYVLTGNCGPNAHEALTAGGVGVITDCAGTVRSAIEQFTAGRLEARDAPNVAAHQSSPQGIDRGPNASAPSPAGPPPGSSPRRGEGRGRQMNIEGGGRGMGRGRGQGQGRGGGRGRGQGGGGGGRRSGR